MPFLTIPEGIGMSAREKLSNVASFFIGIYSARGIIIKRKITLDFPVSLYFVNLTFCVISKYSLREIKEESRKHRK